MVPVLLSPSPSLIFPFHIYLRQCTPPLFPFVSFQASLPFFSCCHQTTRTTFLCGIYYCKRNYIETIWFIFWLHWKKITSAIREANSSRYNGDQIEGPLKLLDTTVPWCWKGFQVGVSIDPHDAKTWYTQKNLFEILLNQPDFRLYFSFSDRFGSKRTSAWIQINRKMVNTIWNRVDLIIFEKDFSVCTLIWRLTISISAIALRESDFWFLLNRRTAPSAASYEVAFASR